MRCLFKVAIALAVPTVIVTSGWLACRTPSKLVYQGTPLSDWLRKYQNVTWVTNRLDNLEADQAVQSLGTNVIPTLLKMLQAKDSKLELQLIAFAQKHHLIRNDYVTADKACMEASYAFQALGARASNAVPQLLRIYERNVSSVSRADILACFGDIGPPAKTAVPALLNATASTNEFVCGIALWSLGSIRAQSDLVVPVLTKYLSDPRGSVPIIASEALENFGSDAKGATSALLELAAVGSPILRRARFRALGKIYDKPEWVPSGPGDKAYGCSALAKLIGDFGDMRMNGTPATPALIKYLSNTNEDIRAAATNALKLIDGNALLETEPRH